MNTFYKIMRKIFLHLLLLSISCSIFAEERNWINVNENWLFTKGNPGRAQFPDFDDSKWEKINIPHDWAIAGPFNEEETGQTGKLPWRGEGWYRIIFTVYESE